ncbi:MAG: Uma2 family endonuclease [Blastocatellales bacterium]
MVTAQSRLHISPEEYLARERKSEERHEYAGGKIYAMAGESPEHSTVCFNLSGLTHAQLTGKNCRGFSPNMKVRVGESGKYYYPDLSVVCGEPVFQDERRDVLINPRVIIEVLSPSTEKKDRGEKLQNYQQIESLTDYLLVSQDKPLIEHYVRREGNQWLYSSFSDLASSVHIASIDCRLSLAEVYDRVTFPPTEPSEEQAADGEED